MGDEAGLRERAMCDALPALLFISGRIKHGVLVSFVERHLRAAGSLCNRLGCSISSLDPRIRIIPLLGIIRCHLAPGVVCVGTGK